MNWVGDRFTGNPQTITFYYANAYLAADIASGQVLVNAGVGDPNGNGACYLSWDKTGFLQFLSGSTATAQVGQPSPGMSSPQCSVDAANSSITPYSGGLAVTLEITFRPRLPAGIRSGLSDRMRRDCSRRGPTWARRRISRSA